MNKKLRIKDIAKMAGVSSGTVDRVIHNRGQVTEENRQNILKIIEEQSYQPNLLARTLANKKSYLLVSLCPEFNNPNDYWKAPDIGIEKAAEEIRNFNIRVKKFYFDQFSANSFKNQLEEIFAVKPDGVLLSPVFKDETVSFVQKLEESGVPYVFIDSSIDYLNNLSYLGQNSFQSGYLAARLLSNIIPSRSTIIVIRSGGATLTNQSSRREEGIVDYFRNSPDQFNIIHFDLHTEDSENVSLFNQKLRDFQAKGIIVINSKTYEVVEVLKQLNFSGIKLIGYDLLPENIRYLKKGEISFLLAQRPEEQGYKGIMTLFSHLVMKSKVEKENYLPIDILTIENIEYYLKYL